MGKRSSAFPRSARDLYETPAKAVEPLLPHLEPETQFIEPCYGRGALAGALCAAGHYCFACFDLPIDARVHRYPMKPSVIFITNPPFWGRAPELHALIRNLSDQAPTWLLMSADWLFNKSSSAVTDRLSRIVAVGRVKWIPDSPYVGKDNAAWLLFKRTARGARFIGR